MTTSPRAEPPHRHVGDELIFVIEGAVADESGTVSAGNVGYRPNGCVHALTTGSGATVLAVLTGDIEPVAGRAGGPRSQIVTVGDLPWIDARPGVRQKRIWEDKATERRALLARFEPGATLRGVPSRSEVERGPRRTPCTDAPLLAYDPPP